ncbi:hypothetical protein GCM10027200_04360 [Lentzea nigeriaca]
MGEAYRVVVAADAGGAVAIAAVTTTAAAASATRRRTAGNEDVDKGPPEGCWIGLPWRRRGQLVSFVDSQERWGGGDQPTAIALAPGSADHCEPNSYDV